MKKLWAIILTLVIIGCASALADEVLTRDERIVALTILGEARGEGRCGMYAVGCVIQPYTSTSMFTALSIQHLECW